MTNAISKVLAIAKAEVGYLEKATNSNLYSKTGNAGGSNYTKYWAEIKPDYQGQPWCACFVTWCFVKAFGVETAIKLLRHYPYVYCPTMASLFTLNANPKVGDIVIFKRNGVFTHTGLVTYVNGDYFETVEGNTSGGSTIVANGGAVCEKSYYNSNLPGTKFCTPSYEEVVEEDEIDMEELKKLQAEVAKIKSYVDTQKNKMIYNYIDKNMPEWAKEAVKWEVDQGILQGDENGLNLTYEDLRNITREYRFFKKVESLLK